MNLQMTSIIKRVMDIVVSIFGLFFLFPLYILILLVIKLRSSGPILFLQKRAGIDGKPFIIYKFRTMTNDHDENGDLLPDEQRITRLGRFLRRTSLDELPELWNVLKGDMSLVGPRPLLLEYLPYYTDREHKRHTIRPGITGLAQVSGRNQLGWDKRLELDVKYVEEYSLWLDMQILLKTVRKVVACDDIIEVPGAVQQTLVEYRKDKE
jgi:lipopolysaccharide/colanic/teichoic acid biosynthesis glycosyltransferase